MPRFLFEVEAFQWPFNIEDSSIPEKIRLCVHGENEAYIEDGIYDLDKGDWIVLGPDDVLGIVSDENFQKYYRKLSE